MEEASGFKQGPEPRTTASVPTGSSPLKRAIGNLAESIEDNIVLQVVLMIVLFTVLVAFGSLLDRCS